MKRDVIPSRKKLLFQVKSFRNALFLVCLGNLSQTILYLFNLLLIFSLLYTQTQFFLFPHIFLSSAIILFVLPFLFCLRSAYRKTIEIVSAVSGRKSEEYLDALRGAYLGEEGFAESWKKNLEKERNQITFLKLSKVWISVRKVKAGIFLSLLLLPLLALFLHFPLFAILSEPPQSEAVQIFPSGREIVIGEEAYFHVKSRTGRIIGWQVNDENHKVWRKGKVLQVSGWNRDEGEILSLRPVFRNGWWRIKGQEYRFVWRRESDAPRPVFEVFQGGVWTEEKGLTRTAIKGQRYRFSLAEGVEGTLRESNRENATEDNVITYAFSGEAETHQFLVSDFYRGKRRERLSPVYTVLPAASGRVEVRWLMQEEFVRLPEKGIVHLFYEAQSDLPLRWIILKDANGKSWGEQKVSTTFFNGEFVVDLTKARGNSLAFYLEGKNERGSGRSSYFEVLISSGEEDKSEQDAIWLKKEEDRVEEFQEKLEDSAELARRALFDQSEEAREEYFQSREELRKELEKLERELGTISPESKEEEFIQQEILDKISTIKEQYVKEKEEELRKLMENFPEDFRYQKVVERKLNQSEYISMLEDSIALLKEWQKQKELEQIADKMSEMRDSLSKEQSDAGEAKENFEKLREQAEKLGVSVPKNLKQKASEGWQEYSESGEQDKLSSAMSETIQLIQKSQQEMLQQQLNQASEEQSLMAHKVNDHAYTWRKFRMQKGDLWEEYREPLQSLLYSYDHSVLEKLDSPYISAEIRSEAADVKREYENMLSSLEYRHLAKSQSEMLQWKLNRFSLHLLAASQNSSGMALSMASGSEGSESEMQREGQHGQEMQAGKDGNNPQSLTGEETGKSENLGREQETGGKTETSQADHFLHKGENKEGTSKPERKNEGKQRREEVAREFYPDVKEPKEAERKTKYQFDESAMTPSERAFYQKYLDYLIGD